MCAVDKQWPEVGAKHGNHLSPTKSCAVLVSREAYVDRPFGCGTRGGCSMGMDDLTGVIFRMSLSSSLPG